VQQRVVRLNPMIRPQRNAQGKWDAPAGFGSLQGFDSVGAFAALADMPMDAVAQPQVDLIAAMGREWLNGRIPNQLIQWNPTDGTGQVGHETFAAARALAGQLFG
jgi:hypothetical protein